MPKTKSAVSLLLWILLATATALTAQPTVAPSQETTARRRGEDLGANYNVVNSFETGYRFHSVDGNREKYRSDVNFGNGLRLLGSHLTINSKDGQGGLFDELVLTTQGLGNDPYQSANLRLQHNRWYRYDLLWRVNDYFNPGLASTAGGHLLDTRRQLQDHDVTFLPQSKIRFFTGFSRNTQSGPGLSTSNFFDSLGDQFSYFADIDRRQTEFRLGAEAQVGGFKLNILHGWQQFEEGTAHRLLNPSAGANPNDRLTLNSLTRTEPYSGKTPFWRLALLNERQSRYSVNARFSYAGSRRGFTFDEAVSGTSRTGSAAARQVLVAGNGIRPVTNGSATLSLFPSRRWTITNHTSFHQLGMNGDASYRETVNAAAGLNVLYFQNLAIRTFANSSEATFRASRWLGIYGAYQFSNRRVQSAESERVSNFTADPIRASQANRLHAGSAGLRLQPARAISLTLDAEVGRADRPFFTTSERRYHVLGGRFQYKTGPATIQLYSRANYNTNSASLFHHSARARVQGADVSLAPRPWLSFDAGYNKQHWDTLTGLAYFTDDLVEGDSSLYVSNVHSAYVSARAALGKRADLTFGFTRVEDTGDGRSAPAATSNRATQSPVFRAAQTFPLSYQSPLVRLSVRLHDKIRLNVGYQHYNYSEDFQPLLGLLQNYRAHTGFTSLMWSF